MLTKCSILKCSISSSIFDVFDTFNFCCVMNKIFCIFFDLYNHLICKLKFSYLYTIKNMDLDQLIDNDNYNTYSTKELMTLYIVNLTLNQQAQFMYNHVQS